MTRTPHKKVSEKGSAKKAIKFVARKKDAMASGSNAIFFEKWHIFNVITEPYLGISWKYHGNHARSESSEEFDTVFRDSISEYRARVQRNIANAHGPRVRKR